MGLFNKKEKINTSCCCGDVESRDSEQNTIEENGLIIKVLGSGCKNCITLADNVKKALEEQKIVASIVKVTDFGEITGYGVMSTPALVVNEKVVSYGKVLKPQEIISILEKVIG